MRRPRRTTLAVVGILSAAVMIVLLAAPEPYAGGSSGPEGTRALRRVLTSLGVDVSDAATPPDPPGTFLLLADLRDSRQLRPLLRWAASGGRLVVADPVSRLVSRLGADAEDPSSLAIGSETATPGCVVPEALGVSAVVSAADEPVFEDAPPRSIACFSAGEGWRELTFPWGRGRVVLLSGASSLTNRFLRDRDNALFAVQLLGFGGKVAFGPPLPPASGRPRGLWASLPAGAKAALLAIVVATVAFAFVRGRRLGRPVLEEPISPIPASELVTATAGLYRRARATAFCGTLMRRSTAARLARRLGVGRGSGAAPVEEILAVTPETERRTVERILAGPEPRTDDDLIALGRELERLERGLKESSVESRR